MRGSRFVVFGIAVTLLCLSPLLSTTASAAGLVRPLPGDMLLDFNAGYTTGDGTTRYHTGVDIAGAAGDEVGAAAAGKITFRGRVPRPAGEGSPILALTVTLDDGRLATYLPLAETSVSRGDSVRQGQKIAELAAEGDGSSSATHLHFGLRENGNYIDPKPLPVPPAPTRNPSPRPEHSPGRSRAPIAAPRGTCGSAVAAPHGILLRPDAGRSGSRDLRALRRESAFPSAALSARTPSEQKWLRARVLRSNRRRPWIDPRLLALAPGAAAERGPGPLRPPILQLHSRVHPLGMVLLSGLLLAVSSALRVLREKPTLRSVATLSIQKAAHHG